jgi:hypothetical protein
VHGCRGLLAVLGLAWMQGGAGTPSGQQDRGSRQLLGPLSPAPTWKIWTMAVANDPGSAGTTMLRLRVFTLTPARVGFSSLVLITRSRVWLCGRLLLSLLLLLGKRDGWGNVWMRWEACGGREGSRLQTEPETHGRVLHLTFHGNFRSIMHSLHTVSSLK